MSAQADGQLGSSGISVASVLGVLVRGQTYKNLLYLALAVPLGIAHWSVLTIGLVFGVVLLVVGIGVVILLLTVAGTRLVARLERWLANVLLRVEIEAPADRPATDGALATARTIVDAPSTWRGLGFLMLRFWVGIVGFLLVFFLWNAVELVTAPLQYPFLVEFGTVNGDPVGWTIDSLPEAIAAVPLGFALGLVVLHATNAFAYVSERIALALLDGTDRSTPEPETDA